MGTSEYGFGAHSSAPSMTKGISELSRRSDSRILVLCVSLQVMPPPLDPDSSASILDLGAPTTPLSPHSHSDIITARAHSAHSWSHSHIAASDEALRMVMESVFGGWGS